MSFNVEDPLAGILSDGSDDSFFDDDILGKKKPTRKKSTSSVEKKNALFDLGDTDKPKPVASSVDIKKEALFDTDAIKTPTPFKRAETSKESIKFSQAESKAKTGFNKLDVTKSPAKSKPSTSAEKIDILSDLIEPKKDTSKSAEKGKNSQSLLDDILGGSTKLSSQSTKTAATAKSQDFDIDSILGKGDTKTATSSKSVPQKSTLKDKQTKEKKEDAPIKKTKTSEDWLGIFQDKEEENDFDDDSGMPSWLVGGDAKKKKPQEKKTVTKAESVKEKVREEPQKQEQHEVKEITEVKRDLEPNIENLAKSIASSAVLHESNEDITAEGAALYLQQQESQIMVALQLKAQEEKLAAMQIRQKESQRVQREAGEAQRAQLEAMLRRQADNRRQMQTIIAAHQDRITHRIKALLGTDNTESEDITTDHYGNESGEQKLETPHMREKKQLLQLVQSLQENHDKEIDLMETSYRRQLAFLEVSLNQSEERMKEESDKLVKFYTEKIRWVEEHHQLYKKLSDDNAAALAERHREQTDALRAQHERDTRVLQEHHATLMENIKNAVKQEQVLIQDSAAFSSDLKELVSDVRESKQRCQELVEKIQTLSENTERKTDNSVQVRETQINEMIQQLKKERENFEIEKSENRETIKMLESRLKQMTAMIEEESATLKQKRMEFEFEKATFSKQTEFAKNVLKKQDEEIKMLREDIQKEYQEKIAKIDEEKTRVVKESAALAREKSTIQTLKQELEKMKAELQAQLEEVAEERSKLNVQKQQIHMEEQRHLAKSRDLDLLAKTAIEKQSQADKKYAEAEYIQKKYEERIRRIQEHVVSLNSREKQIAREKVTLSRERLTLHNERKQIESRQQCSLCRSSQHVPQLYEPSYTLLDSFMQPPVTREHRNSNVTTAMNAIELEMAQWMGRNLNLRHSAGLGDLTHTEEREFEERQPGAAPAQLEPGTFKDYKDPKFMMLRLDVQKVLSNLDQSKKEDTELLGDDDIDQA